jgi:thiol-disulfide isomerase/thioredoxin
MKNILYILLFTFLTQTTSSFAQETKIQTLSGEEFNFNDILSGENDQVVIVFTWAAKWCWPCVKALNEYNKSHEDLVNKYNIKFSALNLDRSYTNSEIKNFVNDSEWKFDVYTDPEGNYLKAMESSSAPEYFLLINGKVQLLKSGFLDGTSNPETTAAFIVELINDIYSNKIYFDEDWNFTTKKYASFVRYRDKVGDTYEVTDRWLTGEKQMSGTYSDFWCTKKIGKFTWYDKDGTISSSKDYDVQKKVVKTAKTAAQIAKEKGLSNFESMNFEYNIKLKSFNLSKEKFEQVDGSYHYVIPFYASEDKSFAFLLESKYLSAWL